VSSGRQALSQINRSEVVDKSRFIKAAKNIVTLMVRSSLTY
jgi:hypothetical protein